MSHVFPPLRPVADGPLSTQPVEGTFGCHDALRRGPTSARALVAAKHPVQVAQEKHYEHHERLKLSILENIQGSAAPQIVRLERALYAQNQRLPVLHSSRLSLDVSTGRLETIDFDDFLNDPANSESMANVHDLVEASPAFRK
eukprot:m.54233 g.54233  ORF g.54233 m.54233 type:complete len:143 (-) comp12856_c0_seq1:322-750(-)